MSCVKCTAIRAGLDAGVPVMTLLLPWVTEDRGGPHASILRHLTLHDRELRAQVGAALRTARAQTCPTCAAARSMLDGGAAADAVADALSSEETPQQRIKAVQGHLLSHDRGLFSRFKSAAAWSRLESCPMCATVRGMLGDGAAAGAITEALSQSEDAHTRRKTVTRHLRAHDEALLARFVDAERLERAQLGCQQCGGPVGWHERILPSGVGLRFCSRRCWNISRGTAHGWAGWNRGCRCEVCQAAHDEEQARERVRKREWARHARSEEPRPVAQLPLRAVAQLPLREYHGRPWQPDVRTPCVDNPEPFRRENLREASRVCAVCPVKTACAEAGRRQHEWGIWGGIRLNNGRRT